MKVNNLDLKNTITCGQIFRYYIEDDNSYTVVLKDRVINLKLNNNNLIIDSNNMDNLDNIISDYLDLNRNYDDINNKILTYCKDSKVLIDSCLGLKMIHQDIFETIIAYIISANNSVSSIRNSLNLIAQKYGNKVIYRNKVYYLFPSYEDLKYVTVEEFRTFKVGFRDKYLYNIIRELNYNNLDLESLNSLTTSELLDKFILYPGIGPKVASCILLFGYQRFDVFPVDTWVKKYMLEYYNIKGEANIRNYIKKTYHEYCGIVIQYMFNYNRNVIV